MRTEAVSGKKELPRQTPTGQIASRSRAYDSMVSMLAGYKLSRDSIDCTICVKFVISHLVNGRFSTVIDKSTRKESIEDLLEKLILLVLVQASRE